MKPQTLLFMLWSAAAQAQPPVLFDLVSHNEETPQWNGPLFYMANRAQLLTLADHFQANGITWNMQSDWVYLTNVLTKETPVVTATTGEGK
ncbi:MAG: hypothetical protein IPL52_09100 [Flavobacteriales bacterium]|nr:hypothetical protein [Flavobacteriales bacterium]